MPWPLKQWNAIAAKAMRERGKTKGRAYLHKLKMEAGGHAVVNPKEAQKHLHPKKKRRHKR